MDRKTAANIIAQVRKQALDEPPDIAAARNAVMQGQQANLHADAAKDIKHLFLASLGAGLAGRGAYSLLNMLGKPAPKKPKAGPTELTLPYPVVPKMAGFVDNVVRFLGGSDATSKWGLPYYGPAMLTAGMGGVGLGWNGLDTVLEKRRKAEREQALATARQGFHDALLSQYDKPVSTHPDLLKGASDVSTMAKVGVALDQAWTAFSALMTKMANPEDTTSGLPGLVGPTMANAAGFATGGYGIYGGLSALAAGAFIYDKMKKRSRGAILDKAMAQRRRNEFLHRPTEITAVPEPTLQG